jgi:hypothetical protein
MMPTDPETAGKAMAEALVSQLEALKAQVQAGPHASPEAQIAAGEAAVAAMKRVLGGLTAEMLAPANQPGPTKH